MQDNVAQFAKMLRNLDNCLTKAEAFAKTKNFDANTFANSRIAPDMYPLVKQVQSTCDSAKFTACYLSGKEAPSNPDTEQTLAELHARIHTTIGFLETFKPTDFEGWEARKAAPKWMGGKWLRGDQYLAQLGLPNFYFHLTTAYNILRHNGVDVGKMDFVGNLPLQD